MKFLKKLIIRFFGRSARTKNSAGRMRKAEYLVLKGRVKKGDIVFLR